MTDTTWRDLFPDGRCIFYEGDAPRRFVVAGARVAVGLDRGGPSHHDHGMQEQERPVDE